MRVLISLSAAAVLVCLLAASPPSEPDVVVYKLGGVELPYFGAGEFEYSPDQNAWIVAFPAPEGFTCTHIGWMFAPADDVPDEVRETPDSYFVTGLLDVQVLEDVLYLSVETDTAVHCFEFCYHAGLADETCTYAQAQDAQLLEIRPAPPGLLSEPDCPGGSCSCDGAENCTACCSSGFHPSCRCSGPPSNRLRSCHCVKNEKQQLELIGYEAQPL